MKRTVKVLGRSLALGLLILAATGAGSLDATQTSGEKEQQLTAFNGRNSYYSERRYYRDGRSRYGRDRRFNRSNRYNYYYVPYKGGYPGKQFHEPNNPNYPYRHNDPSNQQIPGSFYFN